MDRLWAQMPEPVFITRGQFDRALEGWDIEPVEIDGDLAGAALRRGPELHFATFGTGKQITRAMFRSRIDPVVAEYGYVATRTPKDDVRQQRFNGLLGFKVVGEDEFFVHFRLEGACR